MWSEIIEFLSRPFTAWVEGSQSRKYMKEEGKLAITKAKVGLEIAEYTARAERLQQRDIADADYDKHAQLERRYTLADEILLAFTIILVTCHFIIPEKMAEGWAAMGYSSAPWWLEFIIVGIFVSVFGLMRLFRAFNPFNQSNPKGDK